MKKHITAIIPVIVLLGGCTPSETQIQAACVNLNAAKINRPLHEQMFAACVANSSKRAATVADNESEIVKECREAATRIYPVNDVAVYAYQTDDGKSYFATCPLDEWKNEFYARNTHEP